MIGDLSTLNEGCFSSGDGRVCGGSFMTTSSMIKLKNKAPVAIKKGGTHAENLGKYASEQRADYTAGRQSALHNAEAKACFLGRGIGGHDG